MFHLTELITVTLHPPPPPYLFPEVPVKPTFSACVVFVMLKLFYLRQGLSTRLVSLYSVSAGSSVGSSRGLSIRG